jgi:hypothetical protein
MAHTLVGQMLFTRTEWLRGLEGVSEEDASRHLGPMNCISWNVGHLAWHEHRYWLELAQGRLPFPQLNEMYAYGAPMSTPSLKEMLRLWHAVIAEVEPFQQTFTTETLIRDLLRNGKSVGQSYGSALRRVTYHYWYHIGETQAIRQMVGHRDLPEYVGDIEKEAPYAPE